MRSSSIAASLLMLSGCTVAPVSLEERVCTTTADCISGYVCSEELRICIAREAGVDAGRDAAAIDAFRPPVDGAVDADASAMDANFDASLPDADTDASLADADTDANAPDADTDANVDANAPDADVDANTGDADTDAAVGIDAAAPGVDASTRVDSGRRP